MTEMLQKSENVAKNVANENSQDLTEQWKKGELPEGWYWVKDDDGQIKLAEYSVYCIDRETNEAEYDWSCPCDIEQVLAPVPSYDEWKAAQEQLHKEGVWYTEISHKKVLEENAQLKELLKEVCVAINEGSYFDQCDILKKIDEVLNA